MTGLVAVLLALAIFGVLVALLAHDSLATARRHRTVSDAFEAARYDLAVEESLERKYRLEPSPAVRTSYHATADAFVVALQQAASLLAARDRARIASELAIHEEFVAVSDRLFDAIDAGDDPRVLALDGQEDPTFEALQAQVDAAASDHRLAAARASDRAGAIQRAVLIATPIALLVGLILLAIFWDTLRRRTVETLRADQRALANSERRIRALIENATDVILLLDRAGRIQPDKASPDEFLGFGWESGVGRLLLDYVHPDDRERVAAMMRELVHRPGSSQSIELRCTTATGEVAVLEAAVTNLLDDADIGAVVVNCHDVTRRRQVEAELLQAQKMEGIGRLAGGIAHDFNNILTAIIGYAGLARRELPEGNPGRDDIDEVLKSATRASDLVGQLLAFARKQPAEPQLVSPNDIITNVDALLGRMLGEDIALSVALDAGSGLVSIDVVQFEQVLVNLAVNARGAMPDGGELRIATSDVAIRFDGADGRPDTEPQDYICLEVRDTGTGISQEALPHIFEPFFTTKEMGKGTGLGLSTCYGIVEQAGGHIIAKSKPGKGTTFMVYLPCVSAGETPPASSDPAVLREHDARPPAASSLPSQVGPALPS